MIFARKHENGDAKQLETILESTETNPQVRETVVEIFKAVEDTKKKHFNPLHIASYFKKHGMLVYTNHSPNDSELHVNGWKTQKLEGYSVHDAKGKDKIKRLLHQDGAIEVNAHNGTIDSYHRHIHVDIEEVALERKVIQTKEEKISSEKLGFDEKARMKLCKDKTYEGVGTKHHSALAATAKDPRIYTVVLSEETGAITVMKDYKILYSTIPTEVNPVYKQYLASNSHSTQVLKTADCHA